MLGGDEMLVLHLGLVIFSRRLVKFDQRREEAGKI